MQAAEVEVGTDPVDQLAAVFQKPEVATFQLSVHVIAGRTCATELPAERATMAAALPRAPSTLRSTSRAA